MRNVLHAMDWERREDKALLLLRHARHFRQSRRADQIKQILLSPTRGPRHDVEREGIRPPNADASRTDKIVPQWGWRNWYGSEAGLQLSIAQSLKEATRPAHGEPVRDNVHP